MENLSQRAASLRFGRDLRLLEVRRLLRSSAPVTMRLSNVPEPSDAGESGRGSRACELFVSLGPGLSGLLACCGESAPLLHLLACLPACLQKTQPPRACASLTSALVVCLPRNRRLPRWLSLLQRARWRSS